MKCMSKVEKEYNYQKLYEKIYGKPEVKKKDIFDKREKEIRPEPPKHFCKNCMNQDVLLKKSESNSVLK